MLSTYTLCPRIKMFNYNSNPLLVYLKVFANVIIFVVSSEVQHFLQVDKKYYKLKNTTFEHRHCRLNQFSESLWHYKHFRNKIDRRKEENFVHKFISAEWRDICIQPHFLTLSFQESFKNFVNLRKMIESQMSLLCLM